MQSVLKLRGGQFCGETVAERSVAGLRFTETFYPPDFKTPKHLHVHGYLCFILEGSCFQTSGSKRREASASDVILHPPAQLEHEQFGTTGGRIFHVDLDTFWLNRFREYRALLDDSLEFQRTPLTMLMMKLYAESRYADTVAPLAVEGLMLEIIAAASRRLSTSVQSRTPAWLQTVKEILHDQFQEKLTLTVIANEVGVHPVYLATTFRKHAGLTVGEY